MHSVTFTNFLAEADDNENFNNSSELIWLQLHFGMDKVNIII